MKPFHRHSSLDFLSSRRARWRPLPFTFSKAQPPQKTRRVRRITVPNPASPTAPAPAPAPAPAALPDAISLSQILETFKRLENPHTRVFGGYVLRQPAEPLKTSAAADPAAPVAIPVVSGVASPGSRIEVVFADDARLNFRETVVYSDQDGTWIADLSSASLPSALDLVQVGISAPSWNLPTPAEHYLVAFPSTGLLESDRSPSSGEKVQDFIGTVLEAIPTDSPIVKSTGW